MAAIRKIIKEVALAGVRAVRVVNPSFRVRDSFADTLCFTNLCSDANACSIYRKANPDMDFELTGDELEQIQTVWQPFIHRPVPTEAFRMQKAVLGTVDPRLVPTCVWYNVVLPGICGYMEGRIYSDKGMCAELFHDCKRPCEPVRRVNGSYISAERRLLTPQQACGILQECNGPLIVKASINSLQGRSVRLIKGMDPETFQELERQYGPDFVYQQPVRQSAQTARFHESSVNTFRITTLLLNGRFSILASNMRFGSGGSLVDNVGAGTGYIVGVFADGHVSPIAMGKEHVVRQFGNDSPLAAVSIPGIAKVHAFAEDLHRHLPACSVVGWDIALDEHDEPVLIEVNAGNCGVLHEQLTYAPLFGERFDEIMDFAVNYRVRKHVGSDMALRWDAYRPPFYH